MLFAKQEQSGGSAVTNRYGRCDFALGGWGKLGCAGHIAVFNMGDTAVGEGVAEVVGDAEGVRAWPHAIGFHEVIPLLARCFNPLAAVPILEFGDGVAVVTNLHGRPPLVTAILKMVHNRAVYRVAEQLPGNGHAPLRQTGDLGKCLRTHIHIPLGTFRAAVYDADDDAALWPRHLDVCAAEGGVVIVGVVHGGDHQVARRGGEEAVARAVGIVIRAFAAVDGAKGDGHVGGAEDEGQISTG